MRVTTAFNRILRLAGASVSAVEFTDDGVVVTVQPTGATTSLSVRTPSRRAMTARVAAGVTSISAACEAVARGRDLAGGLPGLWPGPHRAGAVGASRSATDPRPRRPDRLARAAHRQDQHLPAVARLVGDRARPSWSASSLIISTTDRLDGRVQHRCRRDLLQTRAPVLDGGRQPRHRPCAACRQRPQPSRTAELLRAARPRALRPGPSDQHGHGHASGANPASDRIPQAALCFDPFHVIRWANLALDAVYKTTSRQHGTGTGDRDWRRTRYAIRAGAERLDPDHHALLRRLRRNRYALWRAWELKERLRDLYRTIDPADARAYLTAWCRVRRTHHDSSHSSTSPARSAATSTASSPPSNTASRTAASKASTPRSDSSTNAATATPTATTSPP